MARSGAVMAALLVDLEESACAVAVADERTLHAGRGEAAHDAAASVSRR